jgi:hypothetical protein
MVIARQIKSNANLLENSRRAHGLDGNGGAPGLFRDGRLDFMPRSEAVDAGIAAHGSKRISATATLDKCALGIFCRMLEVTLGI